MPTPPASSSSPRCLLAVEIGGTKTQVVAGTPAGRIVDRRRFRVDRDRGAAGIRDCLAEAVAGLAEQWRPAAVGAGFGGPVDWRTGRIAHSHQVAGWDGFPLADWLAERAGAPAFVENDANTAALGEARHGAGRGHDSVLYVTIGSGVGGGLVCGGGVALVGEPLRAAVARHLARLVMDAFAPGPRVALAALGEDAVPVGGLALAEHRLSTASASS
jgi:predicted NBD/HSP70 family sugar kinase